MKQNTSRLIVVVLCLVLVLPLLVSCGKQEAAPEASNPPRQSSPVTAYPVTVASYDANENPVPYTYKKTPERVIIMHPGATELLLELGLEDRILATIAPYGAPAEHIADKYAKLNIMKAKYIPSQEYLLEMQPDLLIGWAHNFRASEVGDVETWHQRNIGTYVVPTTLTRTAPTLENAVYPFIADIGKIFNIQPQTDTYIENCKKRVTLIENKIRDIQKRKTVLILQDHYNGTFSIYGSKYLIDNIVQIAGGENLSKTPSSFLGPEKVLAFDPDVIIFVSSNKTGMGTDLTDAEANVHLKSIAELQSMRAIQEGSIINIPFNIVHSGSGRIIDAIEKVAKILYPERFN